MVPSSITILCVDDEETPRTLRKLILQKQGYQVVTATSGAEALDRLADEIQPRLAAVLSDINMPGMDGLQLLGEIKQRRPDLPVMMVSAYGDDERRRRAAELGAVEFITKPVDFDQLKEQLRQLPAAAGRREARQARIK